jgi:lipopolysaccharide/colanic/teichoic acid biosynthesis glycosyltransferase
VTAALAESDVRPATSPADSAVPAGPRIWGLDVTGLHDRFWASHGIQVVRQGEPASLSDLAELYMLTEGRVLTVFNPRRSVERMYWAGAASMLVRIHSERKQDYRERVVTTADGRFERIERVYGTSSRHLARVALTTNRDLAALWQRTSDPTQAWKDLRERVPRVKRSSTSVSGEVARRESPEELALLMRLLMNAWGMPSVSVTGIEEVAPGLWAHREAKVEKGVKTSGSVWVGAGRSLNTGERVAGPAVLWDDPKALTEDAAAEVDWRLLEPNEWIAGSGRLRSRRQRWLKRAFDLTFAAVALLLTGWIYPLVMLAILIEDGRPFFFGHERETLGGRRFKCWKFRSMRKDAEKIKAQLARENQADGPQFFMEKDPRLTVVGRFLRKTNLDELPQFWNVLTGDMSVVGPRPSPYKENQYNPAWREARLSVLPGITGLWQVSRTRQRGTDFQEWIRYDIEYVETASFMLDMRIIWDTIRMILGLGRRR